MAAFVAALGMLAAVAAPAQAASNAQGFIADEFGVGFFYGTFNESPNIAMFAGGTIEDFCLAGPDGDPSTAPARVFIRGDGQVDVKVNEKQIPIYLYETEFNDVPAWLDSYCPTFLGGAPALTPFAAGSGDVKVRFTVVSATRVDIFNSASGKVTGADGAQYFVKGSADFSVDAGVLSDDPQNFVGFSLKQIKRGQ